jgi:energy-coupling factor transporter ATP-binding protein EcfA2
VVSSHLALDDFGATVEVLSACSCATGVARLVRRLQLDSVVLATVQDQIVPWAGACWVYNAATGALLTNPFPGRKPTVTIRHDMETTDWDYQKEAVKPALWQDLPLVRRPTVHSSTQTAVASFLTHQTLSSEVKLDAATTAASAAFEANFEGRQDFHLTHLPLKKLPPDWRVGLLVGPSGSGKSTQLRALQEMFGQAHSTLEWGGEGREAAGGWPVGPAAAALGGGAAELLRELGGEALAKAAGDRPFHHLSLGQRTLLALARLCVSNPCNQFGEADTTIYTADEFTSWLDRESAGPASAAMGRIWRQRVSGRLVCATVHRDVLCELRPCWVFDLSTKELLTGFEWQPRPSLSSSHTYLKLREGPQVQQRTFKELLELLQRAGEEDEAEDAAQVFNVPEISVEVRLTNR